MATRITATVNANGGTDVIQRPIEPAELKRLEAMSEGVEAEESPAQRVRREEAERKGPSIVKVEVEGRDYYIQRMGIRGLNRIAAQIPRDKFQQLLSVQELMEADYPTLVIAAALFVGVVVGPNDKGIDPRTPYFTWQEADDYVDDGNTVDIAKELFDEVVFVNPYFLESVKKK